MEQPSTLEFHGSTPGVCRPRGNAKSTRSSAAVRPIESRFKTEQEQCAEPGSNHLHRGHGPVEGPQIALKRGALSAPAPRPAQLRRHPLLQLGSTPVANRRLFVSPFHVGAPSPLVVVESDFDWDPRLRRVVVHGSKPPAWIGHGDAVVAAHEVPVGEPS